MQTVSTISCIQSLYEVHTLSTVSTSIISAPFKERILRNAVVSNPNDTYINQLLDLAYTKYEYSYPDLGQCYLSGGPGPQSPQ